MIWRYNESCELRQWNDDTDNYFLFNAVSGQTHVLTLLAMDAIELLRQQPLDEQDICKRLADIYEDFNSDDVEIHQHIIGMLTSLDELGLIEPYIT